MAKVKEVSNTTDYYVFECQACGCLHFINCNAAHGPVWEFNRDMEKPTVSPSLLVRWNDEKGDHVCHSFVKDGNIQYLSDCTHNLAGQTITLPEID